MKRVKRRSAPERENARPPLKRLLECIHVDAARGKCTWIERPLDHFFSEGIQKGFNSRFVGEPAFAAVARVAHKGRSYDRAVGRVTISGHAYQMYRARVIWAVAHGEWPDKEVGHKDGNGLNDALENLFLHENSSDRTLIYRQRKRTLHGDDPVLPHGVSIDHAVTPYRTGRYKVTLHANGKPIYIGRFFTLRKASAVAKKVEAKLQAARAGRRGWSTGKWSVAEWQHAA